MPTNKKPTDTRTRRDWSEFNDFDDLTGSSDSNLPSAPSKKPEADHKGAKDAPDLKRSSAANTRAKTGNITPGDTMRDYLNRINLDQTDEIDDAEAARRAGRDPETREPIQPENEVVVRNASDVPAVIANAIQAAGMQNPEWHTINNLPAYMQRAIRGMGRQVFGMMTRTKLEDIQTIANVQGQGPNSDQELRAVLGWLRDNAEDLGEVEVSHGQAVPGYNPEVREFRTNDVRFHVVQDPMGKYIYAWPEKDAKNSSRGAEQLPGHRPRLRESEMKQLSLAEQIRALTNKLDEQEQLASWNKMLLEDLALDESTLSSLIGGSPGGQALTTWVHKGFGISNTADFEEITKDVAGRLYLRQFKEYEDQVVVVQCQTGSVAFKPHEEFYKARRADPKFGPGHDFKGDTTTLYTVVGFKNDQRVDNLLIPDPKLADMKEPGVKKSSEEMQADLETAQEKVAKQRATMLNPNAPPTVFKITRGGQPFKADPNDNFFDRIKSVLGPVTRVLVSSQSFQKIPKKDVKGFVKGEYKPGIVPAPGEGDEEHYISGPYTGERTRVKGAIEREKMAGRAANKEVAKGPANETEALTATFKRVRPVMGKLGNQALDIIKRRMTAQMGGGNFAAAQKAASAAEKIQNFLTQIDTQGAIDFNDARYRNLGYQLKSAIYRKAQEQGSTVKDVVYSAATGDYTDLKVVLDAVRDMLIGVGT